MGTDQQFCYTNSGGEDIYLFTLNNSKGTIVSVTNFGATITAFRITMKNGQANDIVLGFDNIRDYSSPAYLQQYPWFGCAVGRYANRINHAEFELEGKKYALTKNNGEHQLHGGTNGFDRRVWNFAGKGDTPCPWLELEYLSIDGEEGFPGNLEVKIRFELNKEGELSYEYIAHCDKPTPVNLTHHSYFNLNNGEGTILDQEVRIHSSKMLEQDDQLVATGNILPVQDTVYDLRSYHSIREGQTQIDEYDKSFIVGKNENSLHLMAEARSEKNNVHLQVFSTEPILHFYSGKWIPQLVGKQGTHYGPFSGFCLETHKYGNAVNIPHFPDTILRPGETYYQKTIYKVKML